MERDDVVFYVNENGQVVMTSVTMIDPAQAWFWTERWQKAEAESRQDYLNGDFVEFEDVESAIRFLRKIDKASPNKKNATMR